MLTAIECRPRFATARSPERETLGRAAAKIARLLGKPLMEWQKTLLDVLLEVDGDGRFVFRDCTLSVMRQQGKTYLLLCLMLTRALLWPDQRIVYAAQSALDGRRKLVDDWLPLVQSSLIGGQATAYLAPGRESLRFGNGSMIQLAASTVKAVHGQVVDLGILDEAFAYGDARIEQAFRPAQMTRSNPQFVVCSTAGTPDGSPYLFERVERGRLAVESGLNHSTAFFEWSAGDDQDAADPDTWRSCMPALERTVSVAAVRSAQASMARGEFSRAFLNRWVASMGEPIVDIETWASLAEPDAAKPVTVILGCDIAPGSKSGAIAAAGVRDGCICVSVLEYGPGSDWIAPRLAQLKDELGAEVLADRKSCAAIWSELEDLGVVEIDSTGATESTAYFLDIVGRRRLRHRGERELTVALDGAALRPLGDGSTWSRRRSAVDITPLTAVSAAVFGWRWENWAGDAE